MTGHSCWRMDGFELRSRLPRWDSAPLAFDLARSRAMGVTMHRSAYVSVSLVSLALSVARSSSVHAVCNLIPASERTFPSTLGSVTTPFASPGDVVTLQREVPAFAADPTANEISIRFEQSGVTLAPVPALAPADGSACACLAASCVN